MASNFDKSLSEIIRDKGIQNPDVKKRKKQPYYIPPTVGKRISWKKAAQESQRTFEDEPKSTGGRKNISWKKPSQNDAGTSKDESKSSLVLTGLAKTVTCQDLEELFGPFIGQKKDLDVKMHYNCAGIFIGSAEIGMPTKKVAKAAAETYNGVDLDNSTMTVLVAGEPPVWTGNGKSTYNPGPSRNFEPKRKELTAEELDAELDEYRKSGGGKKNNKMTARAKNFENKKTTPEELDAEMTDYHMNNGGQSSLFSALPPSPRISVFARASISKKSRKKRSQ